LSQVNLGADAGRKPEPVVAGEDHGRKAGERRAQQHAFGAEVDDARLLVDQQAERGQRQHGAGVER
jgi:hypothetical protein